MFLIPVQAISTRCISVGILTTVTPTWVDSGSNSFNMYNSSAYLPVMTDSDTHSHLCTTVHRSECVSEKADMLSTPSLRSADPT